MHSALMSLSTTLWMSFRAVEKDYPAEWWQKSGPASVTQNNGGGGGGVGGGLGGIGAGSPEGPPAVRQTYQGGANRLGRKRRCLPALQNQKCILSLPYLDPPPPPSPQVPRVPLSSPTPFAPEPLPSPASYFSLDPNTEASRALTSLAEDALSFWMGKNNKETHKGG